MGVAVSAIVVVVWPIYPNICFDLQHATTNDKIARETRKVKKKKKTMKTKQI